MLLDDILRDTPSVRAPGAIDLIDGVRDLRRAGSSSGSEPAPLSNTRIKVTMPEFFGGGKSDAEVTFDLSKREAPKFDISTPIVPAAPFGEDPLAGALDLGPTDVSGPAAALLDTFAPDISDLSRTGLPLSGVDIPSEKAIRDELRKILRRL